MHCCCYALVVSASVCQEERACENNKRASIGRCFYVFIKGLFFFRKHETRKSNHLPVTNTPTVKLAILLYYCLN